MKTKSMLHTVATALLLFAVVGCDSSTDADADLTATQDVAESLAKVTAEDTGGLADQVGDVLELASAGDIQAQTDALGKSTTHPVERSYDEQTGTWTISVTHERGDPDGERYMTLSKVYNVQFLDADGLPQKFFITEEDTARSISFVIVEGEGTLVTPRIEAARENITGSWLATGVHTDEVTINGAYSREGGHTITTLAAVRTLDYEVSLEVTDLVGPKGSRRDLSQKLSGTISGSYNAFATFQRGDAYREREISKTFTIVISEGEATINVDGQVFGSNVRTGDLNAG